MSLVQKFTPPSLEAVLPFPELLLQTAQAHLDREAILILRSSLSPGEGSHDDATLTSLTWGQILADVRRRMSDLVETTGHTTRPLAGPPFNVGLLAHSGYDYFVTLTAALMLRWTVCFSCFNFSYVAELYETGATHLYEEFAFGY